MINRRGNKASRECREVCGGKVEQAGIPPAGEARMEMGNLRKSCHVSGKQFCPKPKGNTCCGRQSRSTFVFN